MSEPVHASLCLRENSPDPVLELKKIKVQPGHTLSSESEKKVLLAGGFNSIFPENAFPLSPTLQLNHNLSSFDHNELGKIAMAELQRHNSVNLRSYTVETDSKVCVLGNDAAEMHQFLDTYGGILSIEPLLLKGFDHEIPTAIEFEIDNTDRSCRLDFSVRSPIDVAKCNYCGDCGSVCPLQCISENLFLDFSVCNFCTDCETACASEAIDIHGAVRKSIEVPAVIVLGDLQLDVQQTSKKVFYEKELAEYFATLYPCQVDEVVSHDQSICQHKGGTATGCNLCVSQCSFGAVRETGGSIVVDHMQCEECGGCVAVCPTGAMQNQCFNDSNFVTYFQSVPISEGTVVVIGDERSLHRLWWLHCERRWENVFFLQYENVASLSLFHLLFLLNRGVHRVVVVEPAANGSDNIIPSGLLKQMALGTEIIDKLFGAGDTILLSSIREIETILSQGVDGGIGCGEKHLIYENRRQAFAVVFEELVQRSGRKVEIPAQKDVPFASVNCNRDRCTGCMACLNVCRIRAMVADPENFLLSHVGIMCVGCGLCAKICPENALSISAGCTLNTSFFQEVELARAEPMRCASCGKIFGTRKSYEKVMEILQQKENVDTSHFEYCETCRVVKLFDTE